jgi:hypothetical protein
MEFSGPTAPYCKPCAASRVRERRAIENDYNPLAARRASLARYGLTQERLNAMLEAQGGRCAICQTTEPGGAGPSSGWHVDHDHICCSTRKQSCGKCVRGILCGHCNRLLGQAKDEPVILQAALGYLLAYRARRDAEGHTSS